jgi:hypothetical protein
VSTAIASFACGLTFGDRQGFPGRWSLDRDDPRQRNTYQSWGICGTDGRMDGGNRGQRSRRRRWPRFQTTRPQAARAGTARRVKRGSIGVEATTRGRSNVHRERPVWINASGRGGALSRAFAGGAQQSVPAHACSSLRPSRAVSRGSLQIKTSRGYDSPGLTISFAWRKVQRGHRNRDPRRQQPATCQHDSGSDKRANHHANNYIGTLLAPGPLRRGRRAPRL